MSKAKLFVRGMKDPIELEVEEGVAAQNLIASQQSSDTPFSITGVWTGKKADMKFVAFDKKEQQWQGRGRLDPMNYSEAEAFEREMAPFKIKAADEGFGEYYYPEFYMEARHIVSIGFYETPLPVPRKRRFAMTIRNPKAYLDVCDRHERYLMWKIRGAYAEKKHLEQLQEMADTMSV